MIAQYLKSSEWIGHAPVTLACSHIGCQPCKLHIEPDCQCMGKKTMSLFTHLHCNRFSMLSRGEMGSLLGWFRYSDIYLSQLPISNHSSRCVQLLWNPKRPCHIV